MLIPKPMSVLPKSIFKQKWVLFFCFKTQPWSHLLGTNLQPLGWFQPLRVLQEHIFIPMRKLPKPFFSQTWVLSKVLIKILATKNQSKFVYFWNNIASLQPLGWLQRLIYNPMSVLPKMIFSKILILPKNISNF